jgi:hypothetical protein
MAVFTRITKATRRGDVHVRNTKRAAINERRRSARFSEKLRGFAIVTPPAVTMLLSTSLTSNAIAKSGGGGGKVKGNNGWSNGADPRNPVSSHGKGVARGGGARDNRKKARKPARIGKPVRLTTGRMSTVHILLAFSRRVRGTRQLSSIPSRGTVASQCDRRLDPGLNATPCLGPIQAMTSKDGRKGPRHAGIEAYAIIQVPTTTAKECSLLPAKLV